MPTTRTGVLRVERRWMKPDLACSRADVWSRLPPPSADLTTRHALLLSAVVLPRARLWFDGCVALGIIGSPRVVLRSLILNGELDVDRCKRVGLIDADQPQPTHLENSKEGNHHIEPRHNMSTVAWTLEQLL